MEISRLAGNSAMQAISGTQGTQGTQGGRPPRRPGGPDPQTMMAPVAERLGMSVDDLQSALSGGTTLDQLATAKGVSHDDLLAAIKHGLEAARPADAPEGASGVFDLDAMAESIASGTPPPPPPGGVHGGRPPHGVNQADTQTLDSIASLLDMTSDDLVGALADGTSLADLAAQHDVSASALLDAIGNGLGSGARRGLVVDTTM
jgi:uncharacterized protein (DUF433 family)